jgi:catechol 2,3-dioxygenase-like lactoylglutathione lyase family enzyme
MSQIMNRRQLIRTFVGTAAVSGFSSRASAQFHGTGPLKATWVSHYTYVAPDMKKTRDWYHEMFGMQIGYEDSKQTHLWFGDSSVNSAGVTWGDTLMIVRQADAGEQAPRIERFAFAIEKWDAPAVEAELKRRGLRPKSDDRGFWFNDPDGNEVGVFARDYITRPSRRTEASSVWKATNVNHIVFLSQDYKKLGAWYKDLLDMRQSTDLGRDLYLWFRVSAFIPTATREGGKSSADLKSLDHIAYSIEPYKSSEVEAELRRRKLIPAEAKVKGSLGINCVDLNGFKTQVCDKLLVLNSSR